MKPVFHFFYQQQGLREHARSRSSLLNFAVIAGVYGINNCGGATDRNLARKTPRARDGDLALCGSIHSLIQRKHSFRCFSLFFFRYYVFSFPNPFSSTHVVCFKPRVTENIYPLHLDSPTSCDSLGRAPKARKQPLDTPASRHPLVSCYTPLLSHCAIH